MSDHIGDVIRAWLRSLGVPDSPEGPLSLPRHDFVVAIDIGTSTSGYAFAARGKKDITVSSTLQTTTANYPKTASCILFDENEKFKSFGKDALQEYMGLPRREAKRNRFFQLFKMCLCTSDSAQSTKITKNTKLTAENGKQMDAIKVFGAALGFFRRHFLRETKDATGREFSAKDILWVVTIPAIWDDYAKGLMREAARKGLLIDGDDDCRLFLALEPEVASVHCNNIEPVQFHGNPAVPKLKAGEKQVIADAGGGTIDITVHECNKFKLQEVYKASGGPWGGHYVDKQFMHLLEEIFGEEAIEKLKEKDPQEYVNQMGKIEEAKILWRYNERKDLRLELTHGLVDNIREVGKTPARCVADFRSGRRDDVRYDTGHLNIGLRTAERVFNKVVKTIREHLVNILQSRELRGVKRLYLVGGFSLCQYLQRRVIEDVQEKMGIQVLIPRDGGTVVVKGAVQFGQNPGIINERVVRSTYGERVYEEFRAGVDPRDKKVVEDGDVLCKDVFKSYVEADSRVPIGKFKRVSALPLSLSQSETTVEIYNTPHKNVKYTTDEGCRMIRRIKFDLPYRLRKLEDGKCHVVMCFGHTEIRVAVIHDQTEELLHVKIDYLPE